MKSHHTILWQSRAPMVHRCFEQKRLDRRANGGNAYDFHAMLSLSRAFDFRLDRLSARREGESALKYWWRLQGHRPTADVVIKEPALIGLGRLGKSPVEVGIIHHISFDLQSKSAGHRLFFSNLRRRLPQMDAVVTVSDYWRRELEAIGCRRVEVIYNSFDLAEFDITESEVRDFRISHELSSDRPLVYIGNGGAQKGVYEVYEALKDEGYTLVTTGPAKPDLPVRWFNLERADYLRLLTACDVVISMSRLTEGWCRVVHEAMLCGTPVIGSGSGGMRELLEGGRQIVLPSSARLRDVVRQVVGRREEMGGPGRSFVQRFDMEYFGEAWTGLAEALLANKEDGVKSKGKSTSTLPGVGLCVG